MPSTFYFYLDSISPSHGSTLPQTIVLDLLFVPVDQTATGTISVLANGNIIASGIPYGQEIEHHISATLPLDTASGPVAITAQYSGDATFSPAVTNAVTYTNTAVGAGSGPPSGGGSGGGTSTSSSSQAVVRAQCSIASAAALTRTQIENGELSQPGYIVSALAIQAAGSGYDGNSIATLTGTVGGTATRQTLTLTLDSSGAVTGVSGYDSSTTWDGPPVVTLTRWDGAGDGARFLGY